MHFYTKVEAEKFANKHCPPGWDADVFQNMGWHVSFKKGLISVIPSLDADFRLRFFAMIAEDSDSPGTGGALWSEGDTAYSDTVLGAAELEFMKMKENANRIRCLLSEVESSVYRSLVS